MYRGPPPNGRLLPLSQEDQKDMKMGKVGTIQVGNLEPMARHFLDSDTTVIKMSLIPVNVETPNSTILAEIKGKYVEGDLTFSQKNGVTEIHESNECYFHVAIRKEEPACQPACLNILCYLCTSGTIEKESKLSSKIIDFPVTGDTTDIVFGRMLGQVIPVVPLTFLNIESQIDDVIFNIQPGHFSDCIIPVEIESLWGPMPLERLPEGMDNKCLAVTHTISGKSLMKTKTVTVHILHSVSLCMSAVQVCFFMFFDHVFFT